MNKITLVISVFCLIILGIFLSYDGWFIVKATIKHIELYKYMGIGMILFFIFHHFVKNNMSWMKVFTHELTHTVVSILLFRRIHSFQAQEQEGIVYTSGNNKSLIFVSLAPYCLPIYTYLMLFFWSLISSRSTMINETLWTFDLIIGITIAFHMVCFKEQTGNYQTDINQYPLLFSYLFIYVFRIFNLLIILLCYLPLDKGKEPLNVFGAFSYLFKNFYNDILLLF